MRTSLCLAGALLVPALTGCGGVAYHPRPSPRLQVVAEGSGIALARDGRTYSIGMFGSGLEDAVKGNPRAEKEAASYQSKSIGGFVLGLVGSLGTAGGVGLLVGNELAQQPQTNLRVAAFALSIGGILMGIAANVLTGSAQPHMWNAINMYNDDLPPPYGSGAPQYGQPMGPYPTIPGYAPPGYPQAPYAAPPTTWGPRAAPMPSAPVPAAPPTAPMPSAPAPLPSAPSAPAPAPPP
jgi:hypothetical protein